MTSSNDHIRCVPTYQMAVCTLDVSVATQSSLWQKLEFI